VRAAVARASSGAVQHVGHDQRGEHADDDQHHHQLDQGEAALQQGNGAPTCATTG
jgi:hypothetical protein